MNPATFNEERAEERFALAIGEAKVEEANACADMIDARADMFDEYIAKVLHNIASVIRAYHRERGDIVRRCPLTPPPHGRFKGGGPHRAVEAERAACEEIARSFERQAWGAPKATATLIAEGIAARKAKLTEEL